MDIDRTIRRRPFLRSAGVATALGLAGCLGGQDGSGSEYPDGDVTAIAPGTAGGGYDAYLRVTQPYWEEYLGTTLVVENVPGGGGMTGITQAYNSDPDGHTFTMANDFDLVSASMVGNFAGEPTEMSHIGLLTQTPGAIVLREDVGVESWDDFVDKIDEIQFATPGIATVGHIPVIYMAEQTGAFDAEELNFVHFASSGEIVAGLERGEVNCMYITLPSSVKTVQALDSVDMFAVLDTEENTGWYIEESGIETRYYLDDLDVDNIEEVAGFTQLGRFLTGPPDVPEEVLQVQREAYDDIVNDEDAIAELTEAGRPLFNTAGHDVINDRLENLREVFGSEPIASILEEAT